MRKLLLVITLILMSSCSMLPTEPQRLNPSIYYKQDLQITYETGKVKTEKIRNFFKRLRGGKYRRTKQVKETATFEGVGVLPYMDEYRMTIQNIGKLNYFALTSCHEETTSENPDAGWRKKNGRASFRYVPTIEKGKACPLYVSAYNRKQRHGWGVVAFEHERYKLGVTLFCNGYEKPFDGVSICQSREGLIQKIVFKEEVRPLKPVGGAADRKKPCPIIAPTDAKEYTFKIPPRDCIYGFIGKSSKKVHKMYTIGYEDIIIRE